MGIEPAGSVFGENSFYRETWDTRRWGSPRVNVVLTSQQRYATGEPGKVQGRDRVGIVVGSCGYRARGVSIGGKFVLSKNLGYKMRGSPRTSSSTPQRARQSSWTGRCGDCTRVLWVPGPWG